LTSPGNWFNFFRHAAVVPFAQADIAAKDSFPPVTRSRSLSLSSSLPFDSLRAFMVLLLDEVKGRILALM
jgi:hypothetical protein